MIYSYCKKCKLESPGDVCPSCGKRATAASQRDIWSVAGVPLSDGRIWRASVLALISITALLFVVIFGLELAVNPQTAANMWHSSLPAMIFAVIPAGLVIVFLLLLLQGREVNVYVLDPQGAHLQTWHQPGKIRSWARMQSADKRRNVPQQDGTVMHLSQERHMMWQDVVSVKYKPGSAAIYVYHTPRCAPMTLRLPAQEYDLAAAYVAKYCKGK